MHHLHVTCMHANYIVLLYVICMNKICLLLGRFQVGHMMSGNVRCLFTPSNTSYIVCMVYFSCYMHVECMVAYMYLDRIHACNLHTQTRYWMVCLFISQPVTHSASICMFACSCFSNRRKWFLNANVLINLPLYTYCQCVTY